MKKPVRIPEDLWTWLAHSAWAVVIVVFYHFVFLNTIGGIVAAGLIFYLKEFWSNPGWFPWQWPSWDSILDFLTPLLFSMAAGLSLIMFWPTK